jgi:hypothetical protein
MGSAKQFACHIHYLRDNECFDIARCLKCAASLLVKLDRLITGSILRSKLVFLINVQPHAANRFRPRGNCGLHSAECVDIDNESNQVP